MIARVNGTCRLTWPADCTLSDCLDIGAAFLFIRPHDTVWSEYAVQRLRDKGEVIGYRLEKFVGHVEEKAQVYTVLTPTDDMTSWSCNCPCATYRREPCKHIRCLSENLRRYGIVDAVAVATN